MSGVPIKDGENEPHTRLAGTDGGMIRNFNVFIGRRIAAGICRLPVHLASYFRVYPCLSDSEVFVRGTAS